MWQGMRRNYSGSVCSFFSRLNKRAFGCDNRSQNIASSCTWDVEVCWVSQWWPTYLASRTKCCRIESLCAQKYWYPWRSWNDMINTIMIVWHPSYSRLPSWLISLHGRNIKFNPKEQRQSNCFLSDWSPTEETQWFELDLLPQISSTYASILLGTSGDLILQVCAMWKLTCSQFVLLIW